jgi:hypothetical protein
LTSEKMGIIIAIDIAIPSIRRYYEDGADDLR